MFTVQGLVFTSETKHDKNAVLYSSSFLVHLGAVQPDSLISLTGLEFPIMN